MKKLNFFFKKDPVFDRCPGCNGLGTLHRPKTKNWKESLIKNLTFFKLYRCRTCGFRGYIPVWRITFHSFITLGYYVVIVLIAAYLILKVLNNYNR
ncbi:MAG: hypothetical protein WCJ01_04880 [Ignavibacteria bacterium]